MALIRLVGLRYFQWNGHDRQGVWEWPWSSFHRYVEQEYYSQGWGAEEYNLAQLSIGE
jgi:hypothetical protein